jgi:large subunit ribosomal protein L25
MEPVAIAVDRREFVTALHTDAGMNVLLDLRLDGKEILALTKELQRDPVRGTLLHADFVQVDRSQEIEVEVPVHIVGEAAGAQEGGILEHPLFTVHVRCKVTDVPESIEADVSNLYIGDSLRVSDLTETAKYHITNDPGEVVALVIAPMSEEELEAALAGPEIEGEEAAEEEAEAEEAAGEAAELAEGAPEEGQPQAEGEREREGGGEGEGE